MTTDEDRRYTPEHLWITYDGNSATLGVTRYIAEQIGNPQHYVLPIPGTRIVRGEVFAEIEAAKTICEITAPITGTITTVNPDLESQPTALVDHPDSMWLVQVLDVEVADLDDLLSAAKKNKENKKNEKNK
jgi:glycine cleavage system H protein